MNSMLQRILLVLIAAGIAAAYGEITNTWQLQREDRVAAEICSISSLHVQAGSVRDIQEQATAILKSFGRTRRSFVVVFENGIPWGGFPDEALDRFINRSCVVQGRPDVHVDLYLEKPRHSTTDWIELFLISAAILLLFIYAFQFCMSSLSKHLQTAFAIQMESAFDIEKPKLDKNWLTRSTERLLFFGNPAIEKIKDQIASLKAELDRRHLEAIQFEVQVAMKNEFERQALSMLRLSQQVRHDIRIPLSGLRVHLDRANLSIADAEPLRDVVTGIEEVISDLESHEQLTSIGSTPPVLEILEVAIQKIVNEKNRVLEKTSKPRIKFHYESDSLSPVLIEPAHFKRLFVNVIQNSLESFKGREGSITVDCFPTLNSVGVKITDNGCGIAAMNLKKIGNYGETFEKLGGSGLGLYHAKMCIERWGGSFSVSSTLGAGTSISIELPRQEALPRFTADLGALEGKTLIFLDDEPQLAESVLTRNKNLRGQIFSTIREMQDWVVTTEDFPGDFTYILDLHLKRDHASGIDVIESAPREFIMLIWTSDYLNPKLIEAATRLKFPIIPKLLLNP